MAEVIKFHKKEKIFFNVEIDNEVISLPIGSSMPAGLYKELARVTKLTKVVAGDGDGEVKLTANADLFAALIDMYKSVIPAEQFEKLGFEDWSVDDLAALFNLWQRTALKVQGASLGESQASASS